MAKMNKPRYGEFGFPDDPPLFTLSEDNIAKLAASLGITEPEPSQKLAERIVEISDTYLDQLEMDRISPSVGERNAAISDILDSARELETKLRYIDFESEHLVVAVMEASTFHQKSEPSRKPGQDQFTALRCRLEHFTRILAPYLEDAKKHRGRPENVTLKATIKALIEIYEEFSGKSFTHTGHTDGEYTQEPQSNGGGFIMTVFGYLDSSVTPNTVSSILAAHIRNQKK